MEGALKEISEIKRKVDEIANSDKFLLKRINGLITSSGCSGELCECVSSCKAVLKQVETCIRKITDIENNVTENQKRETERDRKIDKLIKDVANIVGRQDEMQNQSRGVFKSVRKYRQHPSKLLFEPLKSQQGLRLAQKRNNLTPEVKWDPNRSRAQLKEEENAQRFQQGTLTYESDEKTSNSEDEDEESKKGVDLHHVDDACKAIKRSEESIHHGLHIRTNKGKKTHKNDPLWYPKLENNHEGNTPGTISNRNKTTVRPNFSTPLKYDKERPESESSSLVPRTGVSVVPRTGVCVVPRTDVSDVPRTGVGVVPVQKTSGNFTVEAVKHTKKEYYLTQSVWDVEANAELTHAKKTPLSGLEGAKTVLLVDTSSSMAAGNAWQQAQTFVSDYISGLEQIGPKVGNMEHVALVTFGAQTRCQQRYTNELRLINAAFEKIQLGGPSPLYGGIVMANATALTPEEDMFQLENGVCVTTKIILITDGEPTEICLHAGPDEPDPSQMALTNMSIASHLDKLRKDDFDTFCVPVGDANTDFLNMAFGKDSRRKILNYTDGLYFSKRLFLTMKLRQQFTLWGNNFTFHRDDSDLNSRDVAHLYEIIDDVKIKASDALRRKEQNPYEDSGNKRLLPIGSRVRRGPDWDFEDQDGDGPGTVVGHHLYSDRMWVHWDVNSEIALYNYGCLDKYSVFPADEPRIPLPGQPLDVGCVVCPGKDWKSDVTPPGSRGVVFRMVKTEQGIRKAMVLWENKEKGIYSYGDDRNYEIQICLTDTQGSQSSQMVSSDQISNQRPLLQTQLRTQAINVATTTTTTTRKSDRHGGSTRTNKNKNAH